MQKQDRYGWRGAIENGLDDLRHTWERLWFGRKVTGEAHVFPEHETSSALFDRLYGKGNQPDHSQAQTREHEAPEQSHAHSIEIER